MRGRSGRAQIYLDPAYRDRRFGAVDDGERKEERHRYADGIEEADGDEDDLGGELIAGEDVRQKRKVGDELRRVEERRHLDRLHDACLHDLIQLLPEIDSRYGNRDGGLRLVSTPAELVLR